MSNLSMTALANNGRLARHRLPALFLLLAVLAGCTVPRVGQPGTGAEAGEQSPANTVSSVAGRPNNEPTTVALLGATGMVGGHLLQQALDRGFKVRALARSPSKLAQFEERIDIVTGDARDPVVLQQLLQGADLVISALGPVRADGAAAASLSTVVAGHLVQLLPESGIQRYLVVSGGAVSAPGDRRNVLGWMIRKMAQLAYYRTVQDKQAEYELLAASGLDWTLVRCPVIDDESYQLPPLVSLETPPAFRLRAGELASFLLDQSSAQDYRRRAPFLGSQ